MKRARKILVALMVGVFISSTPLSIASATSSSTIKSQLETAKSKRDELAAQVAAIGSQLQDTEYNLEQTQEQLGQIQEQIAQKQEELGAKQQVLAKRAAASYKAGPTSLLDIVLSASSFEELASNLYYASKITQADNEAISQVSAAKNDLEQTQSQLSALEAQQKQLVADQTAQAQSLKTQQAKQQSYVNSLSNELREAIKAEDEAAAGGGSVPIPSDVTGARRQLVQAAYSQLGVPYVFGAYQPGVALDCSGFTKYCYSAIGITLPHSASGQSSMAHGCSLGALQPGDLVFWIGTAGGSASGSHVAMYLGNNKIIHANGTQVAFGTLTSGWTKVGSYF